MFTGLVEGQATLLSVQPEGPAVRFTLRMPDDVQQDVRLGDSIALNGCCLTVIDTANGTCGFQAGAETLSKTNLGLLRVGDRVNVERSLAAGARLGGHFVQGHVDGTGEIDEIQKDGEWTTMWFRVPPELTQQMVQKGSVTVDGISLTLVKVETGRFSVALIPHTLSVTTLGMKKTGDRVNIETDILGKYVLNMLKQLSLPN